MTVDNAITHYLQRYKGIYIYELPKLMEVIAFENPEEERKFQIAMLKHNRAMIELELARKSKLDAKKSIKKAATKKATAPQFSVGDGFNQDMPINRATETMINPKIDISKEWQHIVACDSKEHLVMALEEMKKRKVSPIIIRAILLKFRKLLKDTENEMIASTSDEWREECEKEVRIIQEKITTIISTFANKDKEIDEKDIPLSSMGRLIYLCSDSGNPLVLGDLDRDICREYFDSFIKLLEFIRSGEALTCNDPRKCHKLENRGDVYNIYEAKSYQSRIIFSLIVKDTYVILAAFIKKDDLSLRTSITINERSKFYNSNKQWLLSMISDQICLTQQEKFEKQIQSLLRGEDIDKNRTN